LRTLVWVLRQLVPEANTLAVTLATAAWISDADSISATPQQSSRMHA
jgi:hypothetical protein